MSGRFCECFFEPLKPIFFDRKPLLWQGVRVIQIIANSLQGASSATVVRRRSKFSSIQSRSISDFLPLSRNQRSRWHRFVIHSSLLLIFRGEIQQREPEFRAKVICRCFYYKTNNPNTKHFNEDLKKRYSSTDCSGKYDCNEFQTPPRFAVPRAGSP